MNLTRDFASRGYRYRVYGDRRAAIQLCAADNPQAARARALLAYQCAAGMLPLWSLVRVVVLFPGATGVGDLFQQVEWHF